MEILLHHFADVFTYLTAILAAWGIFACHTLFQVTMYAYKRRKMIRKIDTIYLIGLIICTSFLIGSLFIFPQLASRYMIGIFVFEVWYTIFAVYFTMEYLNPCLTTCCDDKKDTIFTNKR